MLVVFEGYNIHCIFFRVVNFTTDDSTFDWDLQDLIYTDEIFKTSDNV